MTSTRPADPRTALVLCALLWGAALGVRWTGLGYLLPHAPEPDAYLVHQAQHFQGHPETPAPAVVHTAYAKYPHLVSRLLTALPLGHGPLPKLEAATLDLHLEAASLPYRQGRALVAFLASLSVPLTFLLARRCLPPREALLPAALVAFSLFHVHWSQQARPHGALSTFTLVAVLACLRALRLPDSRTAFALAALACGLALACLHNGIVTFGPLALVWWWTQRSSLGRATLQAGAAVASGVLALLIFYPFLFEGSPLQLFAGPAAPQVPGDALAAAEIPAHKIDLSGFTGGGWQRLWAASALHDPLQLALGLVGLVAGLVALRRAGRQPRRELLVALAFALPYLLVVGQYSKSFERFALPLVPFLAVLAGFGAFGVTRPKRLERRLLVGLLLLVQIGWVLGRARLNLAPDTYERAAQRLERLAEGASPVLQVGGTGLPPLPARPLEASPSANLYVNPWREHLRRHAPAEDAAAFRLNELNLRDALGGAMKREPGGRLTAETVRLGRDELERFGPGLLIEAAMKRRDLDSPWLQLVAGRGPWLFAVSPWRGSATDDPAAPPDLRGLGIGYESESVWLRVLRARAWGRGLRVWRF